MKSSILGCSCAVPCRALVCLAHAEAYAILSPRHLLAPDTRHTRSYYRSCRSYRSYRSCRLFQQTVRFKAVILWKLHRAKHRANLVQRGMCEVSTLPCPSTSPGTTTPSIEVRDTA